MKMLTRVGACVLVGAVAWLLITTMTSNAAATPQVQPHSASRQGNPYPAGFPAIKPHTAQVNANSQMPTYSTNDVMAFVMTNGFAGGPAVKGAHLNVLRIEFIPASMASKEMGGESVGRPDNAIVCFVEVKGPFMLTYMHQYQPKSTPPIAQTGYMVFDSQTGNLLVWGVPSHT